MTKVIFTITVVFISISFAAIAGYILIFLHERKAFLKFGYYDAEKLMEESFPLLAASAVRSGDKNKNAVIDIKDILLRLFGAQKCENLNIKYKMYVQKGIGRTLFTASCDAVLFTLDYKTRVYLLQNIFSVLKIRNRFSLDEVFFIENLSRSIGIEGGDFESALRYFRLHGHYFEKEFVFKKAVKSDPYEILGITHDAGAEAVKKQYRMLCKKYHPDLNHGLPEKEQEKMKVKMKEIINAYEKIKKEMKFS